MWVGVVRGGSPVFLNGPPAPRTASYGETEKGTVDRVLNAVCIKLGAG
jgi:hypothetical protein